MSTSILAMSHSFVVNSNREMLSKLAQNHDINVDVMIPSHWKSNLIKDLHYHFTEGTDNHFTNVYPTNVIGKGNASVFFFNPFKLLKILWKKKYHRIFLAQETWSISLLFLNLCKIFSPNFNTPIDLWVCQNIKKEKYYFLRFYEKLNTLFVKNILHCCDEIKDVIRWKKLNNDCRYFPFSFNPADYEENFQKRSKQNETLTLGYLGRLSEEKGVDQLLHTFERLINENPSIKVKIAGGGPDEDKVKNFCERYPSCEYLGLLKHDEAYRFYRDLDIFVLTSQTRKFWKEQFGRVIIEAAASGCNFVGSNSGAIPEVMGKCKLPHVYKEDSEQDLYDKVNDAINEIKKGNYGSLQKERHDLAMGQFSHEAVAKRYFSYL